MVTGATNGIGFETALEFARSGHNLIICGRSQSATETTRKRIEIAVPGVKIQESVFDLANLSSITNAAAILADTIDSLDVLINNAGIMAPPVRLETIDGMEIQFATNHVGHFTLTGLILPILRRSERPRVVTVSSFLAKYGRINFHDLNSNYGYNPWRAYAQSKLANLMFGFELGRRMCLSGSNLVSTCAQPGYCTTNLNAQRTRSKHVGGSHFLGSPLGFIAQSAIKGAQNTVVAATHDLVSGTYIGPSGPFGIRGVPAKATAPSRAYDLESAARLWEMTKEISGVEY